MQPSWPRRRNVRLEVILRCSGKSDAKIAAGKKWSSEKLAARLTEGADIVKAVYRFVILIPVLARTYT